MSLRGIGGSCMPDGRLQEDGRKERSELFSSLQFTHYTYNVKVDRGHPQRD